MGINLREKYPLMESNQNFLSAKNVLKYEEIQGRLIVSGFGLNSGSNRVKRGGSWNNNARNTRCANRNRNTPDNRNNNIGFRVVAVPPAREIGRICLITVVQSVPIPVPARYPAPGLKDYPGRTCPGLRRLVGPFGFEDRRGSFHN